MNEIYLGRQAIYDRNLEVHGFELLYRHAAVDRAEFSDGNAASSQVILNTILEGGLTNVVGDRVAFINVERNFILAGGLAALSGPQVVFEIVGDIAVDTTLLTSLRSLHHQGRQFALDDYADNEANDALLEFSRYAKIDILSTPEDEVRRLAPLLRRRKIALSGERIETAEALSLCRSLDFDYLQGNYFSQPKLLKFRSVPTNQITVLHLIGKLNDPASSIESIESLISQDVSLTYKLLRHINSAYFNLPKQIESIHRAIMLLGIDNVRAWTTLISLSTLDACRNDLATTALVRGKMCELLAEAAELPDRESGFTVGLLSILDAITQAPMEQLLRGLPLADHINDALLRHEGGLGRILACTLAYERADWEAVDASGLDPSTVSDAYFAALANAYRAAFELM